MNNPFIGEKSNSENTLLTVKKATRKVYKILGFTVAPIVVGALGGALIDPIFLFGSMASLIQFGTFDRKPSIEAEENKAVAMFHDIKNVLDYPNI